MTTLEGESRPFPMKEFEFVVLMAAMMALQAMAIDVMLPALGIISADLGVTDPNDRQLVIGVFLISSGACALFPGALADRFGRRPVVLTCLAGYAIVALTSAFVTDFFTLLLLRALQGLFSAGLMTMPLAVVRDRFSGDRMARTQSLIAVVFMTVPMLAPLLGQAIVSVSGWREVFLAMAGLALIVSVWVWFRLPETLHPENRQAIEPAVILRNMRLSITLRETAGYVLGGAFIQGAILGYINSSQQLMGEALGAGDWFAAIFGTMAAAMAISSFTNSRIVERFGTRRVSHAALLISIAIAAVHSTIAFAGGESLPVFAVLMAMTMCTVSFLGANFQAIALQPFGRIAGSAASVMSSIRLVGGSLLGMMVGRAFDGTARPLTISLLGIGVAALLLVLYSEKGRLFRRLHYPQEG